MTSKQKDVLKAAFVIFVTLLSWIFTIKAQLKMREHQNKFKQTIESNEKVTHN